MVQSIRTLTLLRQPHPEKRLDGEYHFRHPTEMQRLFAAHPELLAHSREIADRCSFSFSLGTPQFPGYTPRDGSTPAAFLRRLVMEGLQRRYPKDHARLQAAARAGIVHHHRSGLRGILPGDVGHPAGMPPPGHRMDHARQRRRLACLLLSGDQQRLSHPLRPLLPPFPQQRPHGAQQAAGHRRGFPARPQRRRH